MTPADRDFAAAEAWIRQCMAAGETFLNLAEGQFPALRAIPPLVAEWTGLEHLWAELTPIEDLSPLADLPALGVVEIWNTPVRSIAPLRGKPMEILDISDTQVTDLSPLEGMTGMKTLALSGLPVTARDVAVIATMTGLQELDLNGADISDVAPLAGLTRLRKLCIGHSRVSDLRPLARLPDLGELQIHNTAVADLSPLAEFPRVRDPEATFALTLTDCAAARADPEAARLGGGAADRSQAILDHVAARRRRGWMHRLFQRFRN